MSTISTRRYAPYHPSPSTSVGSLEKDSCLHVWIHLCCVQILEDSDKLSFHLQQQRLIELIREGKTEDALEFAQEYLAPIGEEEPSFLSELGE